MPSADDLRRQFRSLHASGTFVMPNPHDVGTTKLLTTLGFPALATTSAGFASTLGRLDMTVARDELVEHVGRLTAATHLPFNVDSERLYGEDAVGINRSTQPLSYWCISTMEQPDIGLYPDSGKFFVMAGTAPGGDKTLRTFSHIGRCTDAVDYWEGEA